LIELACQKGKTHDAALIYRRAKNYIVFDERSSAAQSKKMAVFVNKFIMEIRRGIFSEEDFSRAARRYESIAAPANSARPVRQ
jgi:hypothetical protein